ncbi:nitrile hydratase accessory protein [Alphaproteobacteria bacterium 46_93_T64]|nr:nitrile hydratase accessory protein [Alphaproteobacteria bacterium 46_93_T64]
MNAALLDMPIPHDAEGPVFDEPWQAQAFAMTVQMSEAGHFSWRDWADTFGAEIATATKEGRGCGNENYYLCWLAALEKILADKDILSTEVQKSRKEEWRHANEHTEHGKPVELGS